MIRRIRQVAIKSLGTFEEVVLVASSGSSQAAVSGSARLYMTFLPSLQYDVRENASKIFTHRPNVKICPFYK